MPNPLTPSQRLAGVLLGEPLADYVAAKRMALPRWPWNLIAEQLSTDTNGQVAVTGEILRQWYRDDMATAS